MRRMGYNKELILWCEYSAADPAVWESKNVDCQISRNKVMFKYEKGQVFEIQVIADNEKYFEPLYIDTRMFQATAVDALDSRYYTWRLQPKITRKLGHDLEAEITVDVDMKNNVITLNTYITDFMYQYYPDTEYVALVKRIQ